MLFCGFSVRMNLKGGDACEAMANYMEGENDQGGVQHARNPELEGEVLLEMEKGENHTGKKR